MTETERDRHNAYTLGLPLEWIPIWNRLNQIKMNQFPKSLIDYMNDELRGKPFSGDVVAQVMADWIKREKFALRPIELP